MDLKQFTFLILSIALFLVTLFAGPNKMIRVKNKFKYMVPAIFFSFIVYVMWSNRFAEIGIWSFNSDYLTGINVWSLPMEEWFFIIVISFVSLLTYDGVKIRFPGVGNPNVFLTISLILLVVFGLSAFFFRQKLYPFFTFFLLSIYFGYTIFRNRFKKHFAELYITYIVLIVPVFIIKSILASLPVILYNNSGILGVQFLNVPIEDFGYYFLLILMNITIFEYLNERRFY